MAVLYNKVPTKWLSKEFVPRGRKSNSPVETLGGFIILIYEYSVRTPQRTERAAIRMINCRIPYMKIRAVNCVDHAGTQIHLVDKMKSQSETGQRSSNFWPLKFVKIQAEQRYKCLTWGKWSNNGERTGTFTSYEWCSSISNDRPMNSLDMGMSPAWDGGRTM